MKPLALILAAGEGRRFSPLVTSKPLFPFLSRPILSMIFDSLTKAGFEKKVIVVNAGQEDLVRKALVNRQSYQLAVQNQPKGMSDAVLSASHLIKGRPVFILNAEDLVEETLFKQAFEELKKKKPFIIAKKQEEYFDGGYLQFSQKKLIGIVEKPGLGNQPSKLLNLVFHFFPDIDPFINLLKKTSSQKDDIYEKAFTRYIQKQEPQVLVYEGFWQSLKYPWSVLDQMNICLTHFLKPANQAASIAKSAVIDQNVYLGKGVKILDGAAIKGPAFIGDNCLIGTNSLVIESMVDKNCVIGYLSEVTRSYLGENCWLHRNYIGDSVLEGDICFGAGAITANFRFDEAEIFSTVKGKKMNTKRRKLGAVIAQSARIGINANLMPGIKIGSRTFIGPGAIISRDVSASKLITAKQTLKEVKLNT